MFDIDGLERGTANSDAGLVDATTPNDASTVSHDSDASTSSDGGTVAIDNAGCPRGRGPDMVRGSPAESFCVDSSEVTQGQYVQFLNDIGRDAGALPPSQCLWKESFQPVTLDDVWSPSPSQLNYPVDNVDWCDAATFCAWAGKRLCGSVQRSAALTIDQATDPERGEWVRACTNDGALVYPYGQNYSDVCATEDLDYGGPGGLAEVKSLRACVGGYPNLYDMAGNALEWIDACAGTGKDDFCAIASSTLKSGQVSTCKGPGAQYATDHRSAAAAGFRCCADAH